MEQNIKTLNNGQILYSESTGSVYKVTKGELLVYIVPFCEGRARRRLLLDVFKEGAVIPGLCEKRPDGSEIKYAFMALDEAIFSEEKDLADDDLFLSFSESVGLPIDVMDTGSMKGNYVEAVAEMYERNEVKEDGYIYATARERVRTKKRINNIILDVFRKKGRTTNISELIPYKKTPEIQETGNVLYDAMAYLCNKKGINVASIDTILSCCGRRFKPRDIARVSHFAIREIVLEGKWYNQDCGSFLAFTKDDKRPVVCVPNGPYTYSLYNPSTGEKTLLTKATAQNLETHAFMVYPPFPIKKLKLVDVISFGMQNVYYSDVVRLFVLALLGTITGLLIPFMNEQAYDYFIPMGNIPGFVQVGGILIACSMGNVVFTIVKNFATFRSMNSMKYAVQSAAFDRLFNLPESFYRDYESADLGQRVMGLASAYALVTNGVVTTMISSLFSLLYLFRMYKYSKEMTKLSVAMTLIVVLIVVVLARMHYNYEKTQIKNDIEAQSRLFQYIAGISKIRISGTEDRALFKYLEKLVASQKSNEKKSLLMNRTNVIIQSVPILFSMVIYYEIIHKSVGLSVGQLSAFMSAFTAFSTAMLTLSSQIFVINQVIPVYNNARPILETLPENGVNAHVPGEIKGEIEINNVSFSYSENSEPVLKNISLHIDPGEYVAIVGSSGCGKSTLLKLLLGFEKAQRGKIYYDNKDIDELDKRELRKKFGVVLQEGGVITGSIRDNITITSPFISIGQVEDTIRAVGLEDDIKQMPMGIHTVISEGAGTLSGGQRQRILLARAIVGKPKVIFLDEATSALDNKTQKKVVETLSGLDATKVVIAHRLSTVKDCDRIIVIDAGSIVEQGSFDELMEAKGIFYKLASRQLA